MIKLTTSLKSVYKCTEINSEEDYKITLNLLEYLLENTEDSLDSPYNNLIEILIAAIDEYEMKDEDLLAFIEEAENR